MAYSPPTYKFELNCFMTQSGSSLTQLQFKDLEIASANTDSYYRTLRGALERATAIWYAHENHIYLIGDERDLREPLKQNGIETGQARLVPYIEMLTKRESILRFLLYSGLDQLMRQRDFLPSISTSGHSYYPKFEESGGSRVTNWLTNSKFKIAAKNGMVFDLDLSPDGPALLWTDAKLFTFVHTGRNSLEEGEPVYLLCDPLSECDLGQFSYLLDGAFVVGDEIAERVLSCVHDESDTMRVRSKTGRKVFQVPQRCVYTTADTSTLKELGIYDWWRTHAIPSPEERYQMSKSLLNMVAQGPNVLTIPFPANQSLSFNLHPIVMAVQVRFAS